MKGIIFSSLLSASGVAAQGQFTIGGPVKTHSGTIQGKPSTWKPDVSEYLGVPFAEPPVGKLRFMAPVLLKGKENQVVSATRYGTSCPANVATNSTSIPYDRGFGTTLLASLGQVGEKFGDDCLFLNIWTKPQTGEKKKAVMIWIYGGGFNSGSTNSDAYNGARLADEHDVVVVSMNYRTNIFGFPRAEFLKDRNVGLQDQRVAIEWTRDNIEKFGGDPDRMILFGQSAGGASVDFYSYAYTKDPIVKGFIAESGSASMTGGRATGSGPMDEGWYTASKKLGCGGREAGEKTLECMQSKTVEEIMNNIEKRGVTPNTGATGFGPVNDGKVIFNDYTRRRNAGEFIKAPLLVGNTNNEGSFYQLLGQSRGEPPSASPVTAAMSGMIGCGPHAAALGRKKNGVPAWRYIYSGEFPNQDIGFKGAWHGAEIAPVFGTTELLSRKPDTQEEQVFSLALRKAWSGFAKDPVNYLTKEAKWPLYDESQPTLIRLGGPNSSEIAFEPRQKYDTICPPS